MVHVFNNNNNKLSYYYFFKLSFFQIGVIPLPHKLNFNNVTVYFWITFCAMLLSIYFFAS